MVDAIRYYMTTLCMRNLCLSISNALLLEFKFADKPMSFFLIHFDLQ